MKKAILLILVIFSVSSIFAQKHQSNQDTTKLTFGNKTIIIIEKNNKEDEKIVDKKIEKDTEIENEEENVKKEKKHSKYHSKDYSRLSGLYLGFNQFVPEGSYLASLNGDAENWSINPWKSRTWNINIGNFSLSIIKKHLLLTTGLGFEFRNYSFDKNIDLLYDDTGRTNPVVNADLDYKKDKLFASYVQVPVLLEINTSPKPKKGLYLAAGVIGGYNMTSEMNKNYELNGQKIKKEIHDSFNLNPYQLEATFRIGFNRFTLFSNFDMLPVFKKDKITTENLNNVTIGLRLIG